MVFSYQGASIDYEIRGDGLPILFLHGFPGDRRSMLGCLEPVMDKRPGFRRIYLDLPGLGRSLAPLSFASADGLLELLLAFLESVAPGPFLLAGYSYGGYLAQGIASRLPERLRGLLLICPVVNPEHTRRTLPPQAPCKADSAFLLTLAPSEREQFCAYMMVANAETYQRYCDELLPGLSPVDPEFKSQLELHYGFEQELFSQILEFPTLFIAGRQDSCVGYHDQLTLLEHYPHGTFALLDTAGHNLQLDQPALFEALVLEWLDRIQK